MGPVTPAEVTPAIIGVVMPVLLKNTISLPLERLHFLHGLWKAVMR